MQQAWLYDCGLGFRAHPVGFIVFDKGFLQVHLGSIQNTADGLRHGGPGGQERRWDGECQVRGMPGEGECQVRGSRGRQMAILGWA